jgi:hypothetical protein
VVLSTLIIAWAIGAKPGVKEPHVGAFDYVVLPIVALAYDRMLVGADIRVNGTPLEIERLPCKVTQEAAGAPDELADCRGKKAIPINALLNKGKNEVTIHLSPVAVAATSYLNAKGERADAPRDTYFYAVVNTETGEREGRPAVLDRVDRRGRDGSFFIASNKYHLKLGEAEWHKVGGKGGEPPLDLKISFDLSKYKVKLTASDKNPEGLAAQFSVPAKAEYRRIRMDDIKLGFISNGIAGTFFLNEAKVMSVAGGSYKSPLPRQDEQIRRPAKWTHLLKRGRNVIRFVSDGALEPGEGRSTIVRIYADMEGVQRPFVIPKSYEVPVRVMLEKRIDQASLDEAKGRPIEIVFRAD